jgi:crotonobetainyl-CoA:carnitine CoA-transferase CaiB-like acyl-CoA transferase
MDSTTFHAFSGLLEQLGLSQNDSGGTTEVAGSDPVAPSPVRLGTASAAALAAQGTAIAAIWRMRCGRGQDVSVEMRRAVVPGLRMLAPVRQNGYPPVVRDKGPTPAFLRSADGRHLSLDRVHTKPFLRLLEILDCAPSSDAVVKAVSRWEADKLEQVLADQGITGSVVRSPQEWLAHPHGAWLARNPAIDIEKLGDSSPQPLGPAARPLSGVRVIDFTHRLAGPVASRMLAEQGADVLHVSSINQDDVLSVIIDTGLGKRAAFTDLDDPRDCARVRQLAEQGDLLVTSFRPGALDRRGLSPMDLARARPGFIYLSVSCYGDGGPWAGRRGWDNNAQASAGIYATQGSLESPQIVPTGFLADYLAAYLGAAGVLAALIRRAREGGSYHVKVSLTRTAMWVPELGLLEDRAAAMALPMPQPRKSDLARMSDTPYGELEFAAPVTQYSETKAYWDKPAVPLGANPMTWLPRQGFRVQ